jgi:hypothetical protein
MISDKIFKEGIALLSSCYKEIGLDKVQLKVIKLLLSDLNDEEFVGAVNRFCKNNENIYPGSNISAMLRKEYEKFSIKELSAEEAWGIVTKAVHGSGFYNQPKFEEHPQIAQAVEALGWRVICTSDENDPAIRAHFFRTYSAYVSRKNNDKLNADVRNLISSGGLFDLNKAIEDPKKELK